MDHLVNSDSPFLSSLCFCLSISRCDPVKFSPFILTFQVVLSLFKSFLDSHIVGFHGCNFPVIYRIFLLPLSGYSWVLGIWVVLYLYQLLTMAVNLKVVSSFGWGIAFFNLHLLAYSPNSEFLLLSYKNLNN